MSVDVTTAAVLRMFSDEPEKPFRMLGIFSAEAKSAVQRLVWSGDVKVLNGSPLATQTVSVHVDGNQSPHEMETPGMVLWMRGAAVRSLAKIAGVQLSVMGFKTELDPQELPAFIAEARENFQAALNAEWGRNSHPTARM